MQVYLEQAMRVLLTVALATAMLLGRSAAAEEAPVEMVKVLKSGNHVIVVRHGATYADQADTDLLNLDNIDKQRQLNDKGRADARGLPIGKVYSSRFYRAVETARLI